MENPIVLVHPAVVAMRLDLLHGRGQVVERTLGLGADLTRTVAEAVDSRGVWLGGSNWLGDGCGNGFGGALVLGADLAGAVAEVVDGLCETCQLFD